MQRIMRIRGLLIVLVIAMGLFLLPALGLAQTGGGYDLTWYTIDGGGDRVSGGGYTLAGTAGQPDAGAALTSGGYSLVGGFWAGAGAAQHRIYLPLVVRNL
jgi:hypothetical protein